MVPYIGFAFVLHTVHIHSIKMTRVTVQSAVPLKPYISAYICTTSSPFVPPRLNAKAVLAADIT